MRATEKQTGHCTTPAAKARFDSLYDQAMRCVPFPIQPRCVTSPPAVHTRGAGAQRAGGLRRIGPFGPASPIARKPP